MRKLDIVLESIFSVFSLSLFLYISFGVLNKDFVYLDSVILTVINSFGDPLLTPIMYFASFLGGGFTLFSTTVIVVFLILKKHKKEAAFFTFAVFLGFVFNNVLKQLFKIPRPDIDPLVSAGSYGFPSGHAMNSLIFYGLLAYFTFHFTSSKGLGLLVVTFSIITVLLIGFSRVYLGLHYPSDVIGGFLAGFWWLTTIILLDKTWAFHKLSRNKTR